MKNQFASQSIAGSFTLPVIFLISCLLINCSKNNYNLPAPLQKLTEQTECTCNPFVDEYTMNGNTIYLSSCGGPACDCTTTYYNAEGEKFELATGQSIAFVRHVWSCKN